MVVHIVDLIVSPATWLPASGVGATGTYCEHTVQFTVRIHGMSMGSVTVATTLMVSQSQELEGHTRAGLDQRPSLLW